MAKRLKADALAARLRRREAIARNELLERLKRAQKAIGAKIETTAAKRAAATSAGTRATLYREITGTYAVLNDGIDEWGRELVEKTAKETHSVAINEIMQKKGKKGLLLEFSRDRVERYWEIVHPDNTTKLAAVFTDRMEANDKRQLRRAVIDTFRQQTLEGLTAKETHKRLQDTWDALAKNLRGDRFIDAAGRPWTNANYMNMLTRTILQTTNREAYTDTLLENGFDLAKIADDGDPCPICRPWANMIVSLTGKNKNYPSLADARASGWGHPNCMCRTEYIDETVDAKEIARQRKEDTPKPPAQNPAPDVAREANKRYLQRIQDANDNIRLNEKQARGMSPEQALLDLKRDKIAVQVRGAFPDDPAKQAWVDRIPDDVLAGMDKDQVPRFQPAKRGDKPNSARASSRGGVITLSRTGSQEDHLKAFLSLQERQP